MEEGNSPNVKGYGAARKIVNGGERIGTGTGTEVLPLGQIMVKNHGEKIAETVKPAVKIELDKIIFRRTVAGGSGGEVGGATVCQPDDWLGRECRML